MPKDIIPADHPQHERKLIAMVESGEFEIDSLGRIWRLKRRSGTRDGGVTTYSMKRHRAEYRVGQGYLLIKARLGGKYISTLAQRLVWQHFFGEIPDGLLINHKNGIKDDNRPENLEVVTNSEDKKHAYRLGLIPSGERHHLAKFSDNQVVEIRRLYASGDYLQLNLAKMFNASRGTISGIVRGRSRIHQAGPIVRGDQRENYSERDLQTGRFLKHDKEKT